MNASRLIQILAEHINDPDGGDFEVCIAHNPPPDMTRVDYQPVVRCWLYPGIRTIIIGDL